MANPIVFFSHSSKDADAVGHLRNRFVELTNGEVDVFCASDGQSIPFGTNWVYAIEQALDDAALMFVFLTPNSLKSKWIYFETGHAYRKKIKVIPIGLFGVDVGALPPPLGLLQGFNVTDHLTLTNLVRRTGEILGRDFQGTFTRDDYDVLHKTSPFKAARVFGEHGIALEEVEAYLPLAGLTKRTAVVDALSALPGQKTFSPADMRCVIPGAVIQPNDSQDLVALVDPGLAHVALPLVERAFAEIAQHLTPPEPWTGTLRYTLELRFEPYVDWLELGHLVMGRLFGTHVEPAPQFAKKPWDGFQLGSLGFSLGHVLVFDPPPTQASLHLQSLAPTFGEAGMPNLLDLLFRQGVLSHRTLGGH